MKSLHVIECNRTLQSNENQNARALRCLEGFIQYFDGTTPIEIRGQEMVKALMDARNLLKERYVARYAQR